MDCTICISIKPKMKLIENPHMSRIDSKKVISDIFQTNDCIDKANAYQAREEIMPDVLNTKARSLQYIELLENIHGMILPNSKLCDQ